ncbi:hypothetical protein YW3DRAFT_05824 [Streptomyces sp. MnatMP-M77]|nr:hypothetical protein YW3DRAFT_05824 [Streptomyces sp. MnatMP-M77]
MDFRYRVKLTGSLDYCPSSLPSAAGVLSPRCWCRASTRKPVMRVVKYRLGHCGRTRDVPAVREPEGAAVPGTTDAAIGYLALGDRPAHVAARSASTPTAPGSSRTTTTQHIGQMPAHEGPGGEVGKFANGVPTGSDQFGDLLGGVGARRLPEFHVSAQRAPDAHRRQPDQTPQPASSEPAAGTSDEGNPVEGHARDVHRGMQQPHAHLRSPQLRPAGHGGRKGGHQPCPHQSACRSLLPGNKVQNRRRHPTAQRHLHHQRVHRMPQPPAVQHVPPTPQGRRTDNDSHRVDQTVSSLRMLYPVQRKQVSPRTGSRRQRRTHDSE